MSAVNDRPAAVSTKSPAPSEPSMEDILASIRRIIAEDTHGLGKSGLAGLARTGQGSAAVRPAVEAVEPIGREPLAQAAEPDRADAIHGADTSSLARYSEAFAPLRGGFDRDEDEAREAVAVQSRDATSSYAEPDVEPAPAAPQSDLTDRSEAMPDEVYDLSWDEAVTAEEPLLSPAVGASVSSSFQVLADSMVMRDPATIERIMQDTLRPMLKTWLDNNLPTLVERLVRAEIERVARGGRS